MGDSEEIGNALVFEGDVWGNSLYLLWAQSCGFGNVVPIGDAVLVDKVYVTAVGGRGGGFKEDGSGLLEDVLICCQRLWAVPMSSTISSGCRPV